MTASRGGSWQVLAAPQRASSSVGVVVVVGFAAGPVGYQWCCGAGGMGAFSRAGMSDIPLLWPHPLGAEKLLTDSCQGSSSCSQVSPAVVQRISSSSSATGPQAPSSIDPWPGSQAHKTLTLLMGPHFILLLGASHHPVSWRPLGFPLFESP